MREFILKIKQHKWLNTLIWVGMLMALVFIYSWLSKKENNNIVKKIKIEIDRENDIAFLDSFEVLKIAKGYNLENNILGVSNKQLEIDKIEEQLEFNPFVANADVSIDVSGTLLIKIMQRSPMLRIYNNSRQTYYVAKNGYKFPVNSNYSPRVMVANGKIAETLMDSAYINTQVMKDLLAISSYCAKDKFWNSQIEQLYVDNYLDINLIPKVGSHIIVFGSAAQMEDKFLRLKTFYKNGLNNIGWQEYKKINLKFSNQIVAEKK